MKLIVWLVAMFGISQAAFAECHYGYLTFYPSNQEIGKNTIFMIQGSLDWSVIIPKLTKEHPVYLQSKSGKKINLKASERCSGYSLEQVLLMPENPLIVGETYELVIENLPKPPTNRGYPIYNPSMPQWTISNKKDKQAPVWKQLPKEVDKEYMLFSDGPHALVNFSCLVETHNENCLIRATLKNTETGKTVTYYIPYSEKLEIGHDMCDGYFWLNDTKQTVYEIEFELMDMYKNKTKWKGKPITFTNPVEFQQKQ